MYVREEGQDSRSAVVELLLQARADPDGKGFDDDGKLCLHPRIESSCFLAARDANLLVLQQLVRAGADPWMTDDCGDNAIDVAEYFLGRSSGEEAQKPEACILF